jgi:hypothetical protein
VSGKYRTVRLPLRGKVIGIPRDRNFKAQETVLRPAKKTQEEGGGWVEDPIVETFEYEFLAEPQQIVRIRSKSTASSWKDNTKGEDTSQGKWDKESDLPLSDFLVVENKDKATAKTGRVAEEGHYSARKFEYSGIWEKEMLNRHKKVIRNLDRTYGKQREEHALKSKSRKDRAMIRPGTLVNLQGTHVKGLDGASGIMVGVTPELEEGMRAGEITSGCVLVALNRRNPHATSHNEYTGEQRGVVVKGSSVLIGSDRIPTVHLNEGVAVYVPGRFRHDGMEFARFATGRVVSDEGNNQVAVSWSHQDERFYDCTDHNGKVWTNCWTVDLAKLEWCFINEQTTAITPWPAQGANKPVKIQYNPKEVVSLHRGKVVVADSQGSEHLLTPGVVLEIVGQASSNSWAIKVVGRCPDPVLNCVGQVREDYIRPLIEADVFFRSGQEVEIVAEISFRKTPLKGMKGKVVLATDVDGDVGVEFPEDIGAGSLDGVGKQGHCLYVEANALSESE